MRAIRYIEDENNNTVTVQLKLTPVEFGKFNIQKFNLEDLAKYTNDYLEIEHIIATVCDDFNIATSSIKKMRESGKLLKSGHLVDVRRLCYHFMRKYSGATLTEIGRVFNQGHANVIYHLNCIEAWSRTDVNLVNTLQRIDNKIKVEIKNK